MENARLGTRAALPEPDPTRELAIARPEDPDLVHLAVVGDTYTVLISGEQTAGRFAMLDMLIPPGGGPPPHFHNFDECFRVLEGSIEVHVGDAPPVALEQGDTANIPANAPHNFRNAGEVEARLLCTVAPSGLEKFFAEFGDPVPTRTSPAPELTDAEREERLRTAAERCRSTAWVRHTAAWAGGLAPATAPHGEARRRRAHPVRIGSSSPRELLDVAGRQRLEEHLADDLDVAQEHPRELEAQTPENQPHQERGRP